MLNQKINKSKIEQLYRVARVRSTLALIHLGETKCFEKEIKKTNLVSLQKIGSKK